MKKILSLFNRPVEAAQTGLVNMKVALRGVAELPIFEMVKSTPGEEDQLSFTIDPNVLYPLSIQHIRETLAAHGKQTGVMAGYLSTASMLPDRVWSLALTPANRVEWPDRALRAQALELARLWFTETLHRAVNEQPMKIQITRGLRWKL